MNKLQLKETEIKFHSSLPTEVIGLTQLRAFIDEVTTAKELLGPVKVYADAMKRLNEAKNNIKEEVDKLTSQAKAVETALKTIEAEIKAKALKVVKVSIGTKINKDNEVIQAEINDLPLGFSYTPEKIKKTVNYDKILNDFNKDGKYSEIVNTVTITSQEVDKKAAAVFIAEGNKLPMTKTESAPKVGILQATLIDPLKQKQIIKLLGGE